MPNILTLTVEEPDKILNGGAYGPLAVIRLQWSATETGTYADVSGTGSTPTITVVTLIRAYDGYDPAGTVSTWYRTRFENVGATRLSDWSDPFQVAPEGSGLICSLWDVKQELGETGTASDELILEKIRQVGSEINLVTGRLFTRTPASGTTTYLFDVSQMSRELRIPKGIAAATTLEIATQTQPEASGTYTTVTAAEWFVRPVIAERDFGWPGTKIELSNISGWMFYPGYNTVRVTMALGWDKVPYDIQAVGQRAVIGSYTSKGSPTGITGPTGVTVMLRNISPADHETLMRYQSIPVG